MDSNGERWYRDAVFYEVMVRGFRDSNGDGVGDLPGVIEKLDHFEWLGVDCLWLLPFFESPLRDNGYDISDYLAVHPDFGETEDLGRLLDEAHRRGIRVIADLVVNHTSDQHPWFIESRSSRTNAKADWYVWDDDGERYPDARIIFIDSETSNLGMGSDEGSVLLAPVLFPSTGPELRLSRGERGDVRRHGSLA